MVLDKYALSDVVVPTHDQYISVAVAVLTVLLVSIVIDASGASVIKDRSEILQIVIMIFFITSSFTIIILPIILIQTSSIHM
jgi:hypothetical protein